MWGQLQAYTLRLKTSQGQNDMFPAATTHLTYPDGSLNAKARTVFYILHFVCLVCSCLSHGFPRPQAASYFPRLNRHQTFLPVHPSFTPLLHLLGSSQDRRENTLIYPDVLYYKKRKEKCILRLSPRRTGAESNIVWCFLTSPSEHQLLCT